MEKEHFKLKLKLMASMHCECWKNKNLALMNPLRGNRTVGRHGCLRANTINGQNPPTNTI